MDSLEAYQVYLVNCTQSLLLDHGYWISEGDKDLTDIVMVRLNSLLVKSLDQIGSCKTLRICILADNFLTRIEPLMECTSLVKIDLKGNQIVQLPDASGWSHLKELQLLYLHDNNMSTWDNIKGLSGCLKLTALTLYDTPVSLKGNYRHRLVNNIWSLKALDNFVISDEEIIENMCLPFRFKAKKQHFCVRLYPPTKSDSFETEMKVMYKIITEINRIQAFYSPTLIIQRWIRGYLIRRSLGLCGMKKPKASGKPFISNPTEKTENEQIPSQLQEAMEEDTNDHPEPGKQKRDTQIKRLYVNLNKLMQTAYPEVLQENAKLYDGQQDMKALCNTPQCRLKLSVKTNRPNQDIKDACIEETGEGNIHVLGLKASVHQSEPLSDLLLSRKALNQKPDPQPRSPAKTSRTHLISRRQDTVSFTPFKIIEKAHQVFDKAKMQRELAEKVTERHVDREVAKGRRVNFIEDRRTEMRLRQEREREDTEKTLTLQRAKLEQDIHQARQKHCQFMEDKKRRIQEQEMVCSFSREHISIARAVLRYNTCKCTKQQ
ncbi:leucine-rich repeat and IQ domain-containing protein 3 isoform X1 [Danio rerio]|uniref:Leucine-rich repeat and IQ domain-containing protein 3 isoform X1 n=1 Tax=Danio rerio TaxID=7955 RepID=A0A8M1PZD3_DANRE|nr:leucine-rich repeat and IQ domain-containing protein 3 isoform X1 [Danio rerio]|eukprot:XP_001340019.5 leucine-rich repeat and IQ domain-containing protein 3 isoform X1 [Danio rerio]